MASPLKSPCGGVCIFINESVCFGQFRVTVARAVNGRILFPGVLVLPMLANGVGDFDQPRGIFGFFQNIGSRKILRAVLGGVAECLEQPRINQRRNIVGLAVQHPARLLRREADGQLAKQ